MTTKKPGPPVDPSLDAGFRKWADASKAEQKRALEDRIRRLRAGEKPNKMTELFKIITERN